MGASNPAGPVPIDDFLEVLVQHSATGRYLVGGTRVCNGFLSATAILGEINVNSIPGFGSGGAAFGDALTVFFRWKHANFTLVDSFTDTTTYTWDGTSNLWVLVNNGGNGILGRILAAVVRIFPSNS